MARYFFKIRDRFGETLDTEGSEMRDLAEVRRHAVEGARSLICEDVQSGLLDLGGAIEVSDEHGDVVLLLPFAEAVTLAA